MAEHTEDAIVRIEAKIKNGKLKHKGVKAKTDVSKDFEKETAKLLNDNIGKFQREKILKDSRKKAQSPVAKVKRKISKEVGRDLGLDMS